jgi:6-phosphogluconolactonase
MQVDWSRVHFFWMDERPVAPDHPESNYGQAKKYLFDPASVPAENIHRIHGEDPPEEAAAKYIDEIRRYFKTPANKLPSFDLLYFGIGADAHMGSLFPGQEKIMNTSDIAAALWVPSINSWRITLLPGAMFAAGQMVFFLCGKEKAQAVRTLFREAYFPLKYPAQILTRNARNIDVFLDEDAGSLL